MVGLTRLEFLAVTECVDLYARPGCWLPGRLGQLSVRAADENSTDVSGVIEAIDWTSATGLRSLRIHGTLPEVELDLGFLAALPGLRHLELEDGVRHAGPGPSPLEPPFVGLPEGLERLSFEADDRQSVARALDERFGRPPEWYSIRRAAGRRRR